MSEFNKQLIQHFIRLSWNEGRFSLLRHLVCPDFIYHTSFSEGFMDYENFTDYLRQIRHAIPDLEVSVEEIMAEGDRVITVSTFSGTFENAVFGVEPNHRIISFGGISTWTIRRGKVAAQNTLVDIAGLERQLNVRPAKVSLAG